MLDNENSVVPQHLASTVTHPHHKSTQQSSSSTSLQPPVTNIPHSHESVHSYEPVLSSSPCKDNNSTTTPLVCSNYYATEPPESTFSPAPSIPSSMAIDVSLAASLSKLALKRKHDEELSSFTSDKRMK
ncbi:hypothetical protein Tco_1544180, partial [Tanacetum coccineum]